MGSRKKVVRPSLKREVANAIEQKFFISERRACRITRVARTTKRYRTKVRDDSPVLDAIQKVVRDNPRYGCPRVYRMLRRSGLDINHKKVHRIYSEAGLQLSKRPPKRKRRRPISELPRPIGPDQKWSLDFVHDNLADGRSIRVLTVIDEYTRESIAMEVDTSLSSRRVLSVLSRLAVTRGLPKEIGVDRGSEFTSKEFENWCKQRNIGVGYCQPGNKNENAFIESFNARLRDECLNMHWFLSLQEARALIERWRIQYNEFRPHSSLGGNTPSEFRKGLEKQLVA